MARYEYTSWGGAIRRVLLTDPEKPGTIVQQTQIALPDLERNNRDLAEHHPRGTANKLLARVPATVWEQSLREDWDDNDWARWLNDPDNAPFRVWKGKV